MTDITEPDPARVAKLLEGVGRCIFIYQRIEFLLKLILPHMADSTTDIADQSSTSWRGLLDSKQTLGPLMKQFSDKANFDNPDGFAEYLEKLVDERNDLVHHYFTSSSKNLQSNSDVEEGIINLRARIEFARTFLAALEDLTQQFLVELEAFMFENDHSTKTPGPHLC